MQALCVCVWVCVGVCVWVGGRVDVQAKQVIVVDCGYCLPTAYGQRVAAFVRLYHVETVAAKLKGTC